MSLGGKKTSSTTIDPDLKNAALENLAMAKKIGQLGPVAYTGDTVAGMSPGQIAAIQSGNMGGEAFGLPTMAVPTGANLNPYAAYEAALASIPAGQRAFIESMFINPQTGAAPTMTFGNTPVAAPAAASASASARRSGGGGRDYMPTGGGSGDLSMLRARLPGGIDTNNPNSFLNSVIGRAINAISPQRAPSSSMRPPARPK